MTDFDRIPVIEVHKNNLKDVWPSLIQNIKSASYIAIDTELSGLGNRKLLGAKDLDDRYHHMCEIARTRSIVSLGLSCFRLLPSSRICDNPMNTFPRPTESSSQLDYSVQTYDIMTLCEDEYVVEPTSLRFLVEHGFDFNKQYSLGIPYHRGNDKDEDDTSSPSLRLLFTELLLSRCPVVLHNAVIDLVFLYHSLYAALPTSQQAFLADVHQMFYTGGLYDTKYVVDYKARLGASYLEYVFRKCQRDNIAGQKARGAHITTDFTTDLQAIDSVVYQACGLPEDHATPDDQLHMEALCLQYTYHGWCPNGNDCPKSHDIDLILKTQEYAPSCKRSKKRRKDKKGTDSQEKNQTTEAKIETVSSDTISDKETNEQKTDDGTEQSKDSNGVENGSKSQSGRLISSSGSHSAGFDSFMTGFIFGYFSSHYGKKPESSTQADGANHTGGEDADSARKDSRSCGLRMDEYKNKVYLVGKDIPLQIVQSSFSKTSKHHRIKSKHIGLTS